MEVSHTDLVQLSINTGDHAPIKQAPRRIPFFMRKKVEEMVDEMLDKGIIEHSSSPWASPIVLVSKQDGSTRICVDYHCLNAITKLDEFPLPRIDFLDLLSGMKYFSSLDLAKGYWQVNMSPDSKEKTAFVMHEGLYKLAFGLCNAPATFQRLMEVTLTEGFGQVQMCCIPRQYFSHGTNLSRTPYAPINCKPHPPPGAHGVSDGDLSSQICTILYIWGIAFLANPLQYPMFSPPTTLGIYFC